MTDFPVWGAGGRKVDRFVVDESYGAKLNLEVVQDGAMAPGSQTLACTTSTPFGSALRGMYAEVQGAGAGGVTLITTIIGITDSGHVTLADANASGVAVAGAQVAFGTDDSLAFRDALADIASWGSGIITSTKPGTALLATIAQAVFGELGGKLVLPNFPATNPYPFPVVGIEGPGPLSGQPMSEANTIAQGGVDNTGDALVLYAGGIDAQPGYGPGAGAYLGVISGGLNLGEFTNLCFYAKNVIVRTPAGSHYNGVDARTAQQMSCENVIADVAVAIQDQMTEPLADSVGFWTPGIANGAKNRLVNCFSLGYGIGYTLNEHSDLDHCGASFSRTGAVEVVGGGHTVRIARFLSQWNRHHIVAGGAAGPVTIDDWDIEDAPDGHWYSSVDHIADAGNLITGKLGYARFKAGIGAELGLTVVGGANIALTDLNAPPAAASIVRARAITANNIPSGAVTAVTWTATDFNQGGLWAGGSPTKFTAPVAGLYLVTLNAGIVAGGTERVIGIRRNGAAAGAWDAASRTPAAADDCTSCSCLIKLAAGDYVEAVAYQDSGAPQSLDDPLTTLASFAMTLLG